MQGIIAAKGLHDAIKSGNTMAIATNGAGVAASASVLATEGAKDLGYLSEGAGATAAKRLGIVGVGINIVSAGVQIAHAKDTETRVKIGLENGAQIAGGDVLMTGTVGTVIGTGAAAVGTATTAALGGGAVAVGTGVVVAAAIPIAIAAGVAYDINGAYKIGEGIYDTTKTYAEIDKSFQPDLVKHFNFAGGVARVLSNPDMVNDLVAAGVQKDKDGNVHFSEVPLL